MAQKKQITFVKGCKLRGDPERAYLALERIRRSNKTEKLEPKDVVSSAENPRSYLHRYFEWDDTRAAHQYRLHRARHLLASIEVVIAPAVQSKPVRAYAAFRKDGTPQQKEYVTITDALADPEKRQELLHRAMKEILRWRKEYRALEELAPIFSEVDKLAEAV